MRATNAIAQSRSSLLPNLSQWLLICVLLASLIPLLCLADEPLLPDLGQLENRFTTIQESSNTSAANQLFNELQDLEYLFAGLAEYDRFYAQVALYTNRAAEATWPLERLVLLEPSQPSHFIQLAEAYLTLGRPQLAARQLERATELESLNISHTEQITQLQRQTNRLAAQQAGRFSLTTRVEVGLGYDSNVSAAPGYRFQPSEKSGEETPSTITEFRLQQRASWQALEQLHFDLGYQLRDYRPYAEEDFVRQHLRTFFTTRWQNRPWQLLFTPSLSWSWKDQEAEYQDLALGLQAHYQITDHTTLMAFNSWSQLNYEDPWKTNDAHMTLLGGGGSQVYYPQPQQPLRFTAIGYLLHADQKSNPRGDYLGLGANLSAAWSYSSRQVYTLSYVSLYRDYRCSAQQIRLAQEQRIQCNAERRDLYQQFSLTARYQLNTQWALLPHISWTNQDSDEAPFDYHRFTAKVSLRYDFKPWQR